jgi:hypothetical protein
MAPDNATQLDPQFRALADYIVAELRRELITSKNPSAPAPEFLNFKQAAAYLGISEAGLRLRCHRGVGPMQHRIGRNVRFKREALEAFAKCSGGADAE